MTPRSGIEKWLHEFFEIGIILKGVSAAVELAIGVLLLLAMRVNDLILALVQNQLIDDPDDFFARHIDRITYYLSPHFQFIGALYMLSHGIVKAVLVWGLLKSKLWAYPASLAVLVLFIAYQIINIVQTHSIGMTVLTVYDVVILWLIWHEYQVVKKKLATL